MRFISKYQRYSLGIRNEREMVLADGQRQVLTSGIAADFNHGGLSLWEIDEGLKHFQFKGLPDGVDPRTRLSMYDTDLAAELDGWDDETKALVEERLLSSNKLGTDFILVEAPRAPKPFANYDEIESVDTLFQILPVVGYDPEAVRRYESENQNRPEVLERLQTQIDAGAEDELVVA